VALDGFARPLMADLLRGPGLLLWGERRVFESMTSEAV